MRTLVCFFMLLVTVLGYGQSQSIKVVVDRGHDSIHKGVIADGVSEYELVHQLVTKLTASAPDHIDLVYYNEKGERQSIPERAAEINALQPDLVISFHMSAVQQPRTLSCYYSDKNTNPTASKDYATDLGLSLSKDGYFNERYFKRASFKLLELVQSPAVLVEIGSIKAPRDRYYLTAAGTQKIVQHFNSFLNAL